MRATNALMGALLVSWAALAMGCADDGDESTSPPGTGQQPLPTVDELAPGWNELAPGGLSVCSRGDPFSFFVRPGTANRVVIEFQDGGACWDAGTCAVGSDSFDDVVEFDRSSLEGIHDHDHPDNPVADWTHVFIPYCTGDLHWGDKTTNYAGLSIEHRGAANARATLEWVYQSFPSPERVLVTGCSAGGYGAIGWAPYVMQHYPDAPVVQIADCAAGVATDAFFVLLSGVWDPEAVMPSFVPGLADLDPFTLTLADIYTYDANHFSTQAFSQYNSMWDETQTSFYEDMGGSGVEEWSSKMNAMVAQIEAGAPNFRSYTAAGSTHCIVKRNEFYTVETAGVRIRDWFADRLNGTAVDNVRCDPDCGAPATE